MGSPDRLQDIAIQIYTQSWPFKDLRALRKVPEFRRAWADALNHYGGKKITHITPTTLSLTCSFSFRLAEPSSGHVYDQTDLSSLPLEGEFDSRI